MLILIWMKKMDKFAIFIISHGRPDNVKTVKTLKKCGYTGEFYIVIDDLDQKKSDYIKFFKKKVLIFNKSEMAKTTDQGDNFNNLRTTTHARNACYDLADKMGIKYFLVLDDDYSSFYWKFDNNCEYEESRIKNLDNVIGHILEFYKSTDIMSIAMSQNGDFIGGAEGHYGEKITMTRKCMNSFFCSIDRRIRFISRLNEDVNTYLSLGSKGQIFLTTNHISLSQAQTQSTPGGMTEAYLNFGTYVKSFYSVMYMPSCVKVKLLSTSNARLHHCVKWKNSVPCILRENLKKRT